MFLHSRENTDKGEGMLDRILYFLFRKNIGLVLLGLFLTSVCIVMSGCTCDNGFLACTCDDDGGCYLGSGCICSALGDCNEKCDQSCGACHSCNQCMDNCADDCEGGCYDSCNDCNNGCTTTTYDYELTMESVMYDTQGKTVDNSGWDVYTTIWKETLTRDEAAKKDLIFTKTFSDYDINQLFRYPGLSKYYKVVDIVNDTFRMKDGEVDYSLNYSDGKLTIETPDWTNKRWQQYTVYSKVIVEELDLGTQVKINLKHQGTSDLDDEYYFTKVGYLMPEIVPKEVSGFTLDSGNKLFTSQDGKTYVFDPASNFHLYNYENNYTKTSEGYEITYYLNYSAISYTLTGIKYVNGVETDRCTSKIPGGSSLDAKFNAFKNQYLPVFDPTSYYSAIWTTDKDGNIPYGYLPSKDRITGDVTLYFHATSRITATLHNVKGEDSDTKTLDFPYGAYAGGFDYPVADLPDYGRFEFAGWYTDPECTQRFDAGERYENFDLYAKWDEKTTYAVKYYASLEDYNAGISGYSDTYDRKLGLDLNLDKDDLKQKEMLPPDAERYTYNIIGWQIVNKKDGTTTLSAPITRLETETYDTDIELIAAFAHKVTLIIDSSKESLNGEKNEHNVLYGQSYDLPVPTTTEEGKQFKGWRTDDGTIISDGNGHIEKFIPHSSLPAPVDTSYLVPVWEERVLTITFEWTENGESKTTTRMAKAGELISDIPTVPEMPGYEFTGWFNGDEKFDQTVPVTKDVMYTAKYEPKTYTITLVVRNSDGTETVLRTVSVKYGEKADLGTAPVSGSEEFVCWEDRNGTAWTDNNGNMTNNYALTDNITLYAFIW